MFTLTNSQKNELYKLIVINMLDVIKDSDTQSNI